MTSDRASYATTAGGVVDGTVAAWCEGRALAPTSAQGSVLLNVSGGSLRIVRVDLNRTLVSDGDRGLELSREGRYTEHSLVVGNETVSISWSSTARRILFGADALGAPLAGPVEFAWTSPGFEWGTLRQVTRLGTFWVRSDANAPMETMAPFVGWFRSVGLDRANLSAAGALQFYLEDSSIQWTHQGYQTGPYLRRDSTSVGLASVEKEHYSFAILEAKSAIVAWPDFSGVAMCTDLRMDVVGAALLHQVSGNATVDASPIAFQGQELTLAGRFTLKETIQVSETSGWAQGNAQGDFGWLALDFSTPIAGSAPGSIAPTSVIATLGIVALAALLLKFAIGLYARIRRDNVASDYSRKGIRDLITTTNGITFGDLCRDVQVNPSTARYHLHMLQRYGEIRVVKVKGQLCYLPADGDILATSQGITLRMDRKVSSLLDHLKAGPAAASRVVAHLTQQWNLSRSGSWRVIERAVRAKLIEKTWVEGELQLCMRSDAP